MANYYGTVRSNDFLTKNKEKAEALLGSIMTDGEMFFEVTPTEEKGVFSCWFGCYGNIYGVKENYLSTYNGIEDEDEEDEGDYNLMIKELQDILLEKEVINIVGVGYEKLRYVGGGCLVITKNHCEYIDIIKEAKKMSQELLNKEPQQ